MLKPIAWQECQKNVAVPQCAEEATTLRDLEIAAHELASYLIAPVGEELPEPPPEAIRSPKEMWFCDLIVAWLYNLALAAQASTSDSKAAKEAVVESIDEARRVARQVYKELLED